MSGDPRDRSIVDLRAGDEFRRGLKDRADGWKGPAPLWHGWALMDAFLAGIDYAEQKKTEAATLSPSEGK